MPDHSHHPIIDRDWQHRASCRGADTEMFFSPDGERGRGRAQREHAAKQICQDCPVLAACRAHALTATESHGIWGGMSETERSRHTRRTRRAARPPGACRGTGPSSLAGPNAQSMR
ncbi:WhiB family transcriptional regulator [Rhodococcus sp. NPDC127530]|uniref:WhiB family transcriptional regulator n=1 Tax=unclassified Rhodococcus (in: high G+C Gram-positive bacteria) TaxID=192944 RepID=UPI003638713C